MKTIHGLLLLVILALLGMLGFLRPIEGFQSPRTPPPGARPAGQAGGPQQPPPAMVSANDAMQLLVKLRDSNTEAAKYMNNKENKDMEDLTKLIRFVKSKR